MAELRWHPLLREWTIVADERQERPVLPEGRCPLCPGVLELPRDYHIASFENRFPSLRREPRPPDIAGDELYRVRANEGICEVLVYCAEHEREPSELSISQLTDLVEVWVDRTSDLAQYGFVDCVFIFENRGKDVGVTLHHPHGQIYGIPYVPPIIEREIHSAQAYFGNHGVNLFDAIIDREAASGERVVFNDDNFVAFVPFFARYPYEVHLYATAAVPDLRALAPEQYKPLARALKTVRMKYDALFATPLPHMMVFHQAPLDGGNHEHYRFHIEFYPLQRAADKLKYRAGVESGAGTFTVDIAPETMARELRSMDVDPDD
ncbi:MAG: galactose-1-phosphate uridylyltransferase [Candidatus Bipolaricaulia bacterium]